MENEEQRKLIDLANSKIPCTDILVKSKGSLYCCPVCGSGTHAHGTGAVQYYPETNSWYCHKCGAGKDVIAALQGNGTFADAIQRAAEMVTGYSSKVSMPVKEKPTVSDCTDYYRYCADRITDDAALSYLQARGISVETARKYMIGFDPESDPAESGFKSPRIIIPVTAQHYVGRSIDPNSAYPKMNRKDAETGIFNYKAISAGGTVYVTEGAFDALSICEVGESGIATNSTSNAAKLIERLKASPAPKGTMFVVSFDNDKSKATYESSRAAERQLNESLNALGYTSIIYNIAGQYKDANEHLTADRDGFIYELTQAKKELPGDALTDFFAKIQTRAYEPYETGLKFFDDLLGGGMLRQSLFILMAAPGVGKTTLYQQIAEEMAARGKSVIYFNLEMSVEQMLAKSISRNLSQNGIRMTATDVLQGYNWTDEKRAAVTDAMDRYRKTVYPHIKYNPAGVGSDLDSILSYLHSVGESAKARQEQAPVVVIDYLHLITTKKGLENQELLKQAVLGLKEYARQYDTIVMTISATNRETNKAGAITLESGRDSSNIEYTGDYQLSLAYEEVESGTVQTQKIDAYSKLQQAEQRNMILRVLKGRMIAPGRKAKIVFNAAQNTFYGVDDFQPVVPDQEPFERKKPLQR